MKIDRAALVRELERIAAALETAPARAKETAEERLGGDDPSKGRAFQLGWLQSEVRQSANDLRAVMAVHLQAVPS